MYYKGYYHLFYQYNPYGAVWRPDIIWAHSVSTDLVNWVHLDHAIYPTETFDINGCWSGSATILPGNKPVILYTGGDSKNHQVQNLALPVNLSDPLLQSWVKLPQNPLITPINGGIDPENFRDPTTAWQGPDGEWRVLVGTQGEHGGMAILYRSRDFVNWTESQYPFRSREKTSIWECPDFYPVSLNTTNGVDTSVNNPSVKHVLKVNFNSHDYYTLGSYSSYTDEYIPDTDFMDSDLRYDYGKFYASKSFFDPAKNRRILWAWVNESDSESEDIKRGWSGLQSIPRSAWLGKTGRQLVQWPVEEIEKLRINEVNFKGENLRSETVFEVSGVTASQADIEVSFELPKLAYAELMDPSWVDPQLLCSDKGASVKGGVGPFGLLVLASEDLKEHTAIFFRVFKNKDRYVVLMCSDQSRSSLSEEIDKTTYGAFVDVDPRHENISLRSLIDHSIVESFGGEGRACITARVYPKLAIDEEARLYAFNNGTENVIISRLRAWSMKSALIY
ncbi:PREDICTED: beta-fructofuranosidase, insoluble isoenzyme CWINV3-like isoform X2 [Nelumbo nucifera]|nr:PREDICTED: beta-fructofuranosidase, insoluble isoenzyme CWINV3-like isoform X2 [Nelumbo nucifera]